MAPPLAEQRAGNAGGTIVISQPMYFPWVGQLEQIALADIFVFYDDVQFTRGFFNRVQIKTAQGNRWMTVPLRGQHQGDLIRDVQIDNQHDWQRSHIEGFRQASKGAPFLDDAMDLMKAVFSIPYANLAELSIASTRALARYYSLDTSCRFLQSSELPIAGHSTPRLIDICASQGANHYLTGHGAARYLDHEAFERRNIDVSYIEYGCKRYPQLHGDFTPYGTSLDLVANCGQEGRDYIRGYPISWRKFINMKNGLNEGASR